MNWEKYEEILADVDTLTGRVDDKRLRGDFLKRIITRLDEFSSECEECRTVLVEVHEHIRGLLQKSGPLETADFKHHRVIMHRAAAHLQKSHKLVEEGSYVGMYMSLCIALGLPIGMLIFDNIGLGMMIGVAIGVIIGSTKDADAKKKRLTI